MGRKSFTEEVIPPSLEETGGVPTIIISDPVTPEVTVPEVEELPATTLAEQAAGREALARKE